MKIKKIRNVAIISAITATAIIAPTVAVTSINASNNNSNNIANNSINSSNLIAKSSLVNNAIEPNLNFQSGNYAETNYQFLQNAINQVNSNTLTISTLGTETLPLVIASSSNTEQIWKYFNFSQLNNSFGLIHYSMSIQNNTINNSNGSMTVTVTATINWPFGNLPGQPTSLSTNVQIYGAGTLYFSNSTLTLSSLLDQLPKNIELNSNVKNMYTLQANSDNMSSLIATNLPKLPNGFNYIYSINNNKSSNAISNGTINLSIQVVETVYNLKSTSKTYNLSGFRQGTLVNPYFTTGTPILSNNITVVVAKNTSMYTLSLASSDYISNLTQSVDNVLINGQITPDISIFQTSTGQSFPNGGGILFGLSTDLYSQANEIGNSTTTMYLKLQNLEGSSAVYQINNLEYVGWFLQSIANGITKANINVSSTIKNVSPNAITQANLSSYVTLNNNSLPFYKGVTYGIQLQSVNANTGQITISVMVRYSSDGVGRTYITIPGFLSKTQEIINQGTISKYNPVLTNIAINNTNNVNAFYNNVSIIVPKGLTILAWKAAAYKQGINGTLQGGNINSNGNIGGIQFLLNNQAWSGTPFITWSYGANMSNTTINTPQPTGQNFIYIRVFPSSGGWFGIKVNGFAVNKTISRYDTTNSNIPSSNINSITNISNNMTITVPSDLTIAAWKIAAYNDGINGTLQGAHINTNGNVGGLQFLLNNQAWSGTPFITWSYGANMSNTTINTPQPVGQNFIYIRVFPAGSNAWFGVKVTGFATSIQNNNLSANSLVSAIPSELTSNSAAANFYALQVNNTNVSSLLDNLPQLPNGFNYIYSVSNNNSTSAISNGSITLNIEVYDASTNTTSFSRTFTLNGFRQGTLVNPYFTTGTPILSNISVVVAKDTSIYALSSASSNYISNLTKSVDNILINGQITPDISIFQTSTGQSLPNGDGILFGLSTDLYSQANIVGINTTTMYLKLQNLDGSSAIYQINNLQYTAWFLQSIANKITIANISVSSAIQNISPNAITQANLSSYITFNGSSLPFTKGITYDIQLQSVNANTGQITISVMVGYSVGAAQSIFITIPGFSFENQQVLNSVEKMMKSIF